MANFLNVITNFLNVQQIKSSQKQRKTLQPTYEANERMVEEMIYSMRVEQSKMQPNEAARHCVKIAMLDSSGIPVPFYVLTNSNGVKEASDITKNSEELVSYLKQNVNSEQTKSFLNAAASVLSNIQRIAKGKTIIGYTYNLTLKDKFINFQYSLNTSDTELNYAWDKAQLSSSRMDILQKVLGQKYRQLPIEIRTTIVALNHPFNSIYWRMIKHQIQQPDTLNETVFNAVKKYSELQSVLDDGYNLKGLNLGKETQIAIIQRAIALGNKPDGTKYVDDLRTEDGWLEEQDMVKIYKDNEDLMKRNCLSETMKDELHQERVQKQQQEFQRKQIEAIKEQSRVTLRAQIAQLKAQESALRAQLNSTTDATRKSSLKNQANALRIQISNLESELNRI